MYVCVWTLVALKRGIIAIIDVCTNKAKVSAMNGRAQPPAATDISSLG